MGELLNKLSSYNLFNYLLPGVLFVVISRAVTHYSFVQEDLVLGLFLYYFIGLVLSRIGSLVIEPILKMLKFLHFVDYKAYVAASKKDTKIELLSEVNNTYRTLCSLISALLLLMLCEKIKDRFPALGEWGNLLILALLLVLFLLSYRKQTAYVRQRVEANG